MALGFGLKEKPPSDCTSAGRKKHQLSLPISINSTVAECDEMNQMNATSLLLCLPQSWATVPLCETEYVMLGGLQEGAL